MINAKWITVQDYSPEHQYYFLAAKSWNIGAVPEKTMIQITADCRYNLFINGSYIISGPVRGTAKLQYYDEIDITEFLHTGRNDLEVEVFSLQEENFVFNSHCPALLLEIYGMIASDETFQVQPDCRYVCDVPYYTTQSGRMEFCDLRIAAQSKWQNAVLADEPKLSVKKLKRNPLMPLNKKNYYPADVPKKFGVIRNIPENPHDIPPFLHTEKHFELNNNENSEFENLLSVGKDCIFPAQEKGIGFIVDFAHEVSGRMEIRLNAPAGTAIQVIYAETMTNDRLPAMFPEMDYHFTDCFVCKEGENILTTHFNERGFRMLQIMIRNFDRPVAIHSVQGIDMRYPFAKRGEFFCSDYRLNRIYEVCCETISACSSDVFMDCPWRERAFWVNDLLVNNLSSLTCFGVSEIHRHVLELLFSQQHESGMIPAVVPQKAGSRIFAATNLFMTLILKDYLMYSNDIDTVKQYLPNVEKILESAWNLADDEGILRSSGLTAIWNFFDWSFEINNYSLSGTKESMLSSLFIIAEKTFEELSAEADYQFDRKKHLERRRLTAANLEKRFLNQQSNLLEDEVKLIDSNTFTKISSQLAHALFLLSGEYSADRKKDFEAALDSEKCLMPDYYLHYFWFRAANRELDSVGLERIRNFWGRCIDTGSPTLYEAGVHSFGVEAMDGAGSLCHGFGTIPVNFFQEKILGVKPLKAGFKEFSFEPQLFDLEFARGRVPVPGGSIQVELTESGANIIIPCGCKCCLADGKCLEAGRHHIDFTLIK